MDELIGLAIRAAEKSAARKRQSGDPQAVLGAVPANSLFRAAGVPATPGPPAVSAPPIAVPTRTLPPVVRLAGGLREMFQDGNSLLRAVIAAEVLGPPRALQESFYWQASRANEPSSSPD